MLNISKFLGKFTGLKPPERFIREICIKIISETVKVTLKNEDIQIQGNTIYLTPHPLVKNEIFLQKDILLEKLNQELQQYKKVIKNIN